MFATLRGATSTGAAFVAAALLLAPAAAAENVGAFLDELSINKAGLPGKTADQTVAAGHEVCQQLRNGVSVLNEISAVETKYQFNQGTLFVSAAATNLCPDFAAGNPAPAAAAAAAAPAVHVEQYITGYCTPPSGQDCNASPSVHFDAAKGQRVVIRYTPDGCSDAIFHFFVDGKSGAGAPSVGRPGHQISGTPVEIKETGGHDASLRANGIKGGCNTGTLESWGGTIVVDSVT